MNFKKQLLAFIEAGYRVNYLYVNLEQPPENPNGKPGYGALRFNPPILKNDSTLGCTRCTKPTGLKPPLELKLSEAVELICDCWWEQKQFKLQEPAGAKAALTLIQAVETHHYLTRTNHPPLVGFGEMVEVLKNIEAKLTPFYDDLGHYRKWMDTLKPHLEAFKKQIYDQAQVIKTEEIIKHYRQRYPHIKVTDSEDDTWVLVAANGLSIAEKTLFGVTYKSDLSLMPLTVYSITLEELLRKSSKVLKKNPQELREYANSPKNRVTLQAGVLTPEHKEILNALYTTQTGDAYASVSEVFKAATNI